MSMLGNMMEIKAQVQTMISRQGQVVGDGIYKRCRIPPTARVPIATIRQTRQCCNLSWHGGMIAGMITPHRIAAHLPVEIISQGKIQLMAIVILVVIPVLIELIILPLVPGKRIGTAQGQVIGTLCGICLQTIEQSLAVHHLTIPIFCRRFDSQPTAVLQKML